MTVSLRLPISLLTAAAMALGQLSALAALADPISRADYEACQAQDDTALRAADRRNCDGRHHQRHQSRSITKSWSRTNGGKEISTRSSTPASISPSQEVTNETSWSDRLQSLANSRKVATTGDHRLPSGSTARMQSRPRIEESRFRRRKGSRQDHRICEFRRHWPASRVPQGLSSARATAGPSPMPSRAMRAKMSWSTRTRLPAGFRPGRS